MYTGSLPFFDRLLDGEDMVDLLVDEVNYRSIAKIELNLNVGIPSLYVHWPPVKLFHSMPNSGTVKANTQKLENLAGTDDSHTYQ